MKDRQAELLSLASVSLGLRLMETGGTADAVKIPANRPRFSRFRDLTGSGVIQWQEWQIVQSQLDLRDLSP